jgi:hypothetical protein
MTRSHRRAKEAGEKFEKAVADYLAWALDDSRIERRRQSGANDRGDITGIMIDGKRVVIECKDTKQANLSGHLREAMEEAGNDDAAFWALAQKRVGIGISSREGVGNQLIAMTLEQYATLLNHGLPLGPEVES